MTKDCGMIQEVLAEVARLPEYKHSVSKIETSGYSNWIYRLVPDTPAKGNTLCLRIAKHDNIRSLSYIGSIFQQQVAHGCLPSVVVPHIHHIDARFSIMDFVSGEPLGNWFEIRKDTEYRILVLKGIANFFCYLWRFQMPLDVPVPRSDGSYRKWLIHLTDRCFRRALTQVGNPWGDPMTFLIRRCLIDELAKGTELDGIDYIRHGDLNASNIMIGKHGLTGIVDWDWSTLVPLAGSVHYPTFLANIPGWNEAGPSDADYSEDREYLLNAIEADLRDEPKLRDRVLQLLKTSYDRQFFELSLSVKAINEHYISHLQQDVIFGGNNELLQRQLQEFLARNHNLLENEEIKHLMQRLQ